MASVPGTKQRRQHCAQWGTSPWHYLSASKNASAFHRAARPPLRTFVPHASLSNSPSSLLVMARHATRHPRSTDCQYQRACQMATLNDSSIQAQSDGYGRGLMHKNNYERREARATARPVPLRAKQHVDELHCNVKLRRQQHITVGQHIQRTHNSCRHICYDVIGLDAPHPHKRSRHVRPARLATDIRIHLAVRSGLWNSCKYAT